MMPKFLFFCHLELSYFLNCAILFLYNLIVAHATVSMNGDDLMELLQLYYFKVLAEREHLTRTAESLMIAFSSAM